MVEKIKTVRTEAYQLWLKASPEELGWEHPPTLLGNLSDPLNTWGDMSHLLPMENFTANGGEVKNLAYFVGPMPDHIPVPEAGQAVREDAEAVKREMARHFWRKAAVREPGTNELQLDPSLIESEYFRTNTTPSDRYATSSAWREAPSSGCGPVNRGSRT